MTDALNRKVGEVVGAGRFPFVYGGDCSTLLGIVTGLRDHVGDVGLVFIDGHEDTMPLDVSEDGEAANTEIGLLLGLTGRLLTGELGDRLPALRPEQLLRIQPEAARTCGPLPRLCPHRRNGSGREIPSGGGGIRTLEGLAPLPVFKTGAFDHSATPPERRRSG